MNLLRSKPQPQAIVTSSPLTAAKRSLRVSNSVRQKADSPLELPAPVGPLVRMRHALVVSDPLALFHIVRHLKETRARDVVVVVLDAVHDLAVL